jgi:precorrin-4 methylase
MKVVFIGAGPGAADLLTLRGAAAIGSADIVIWARASSTPRCSSTRNRARASSTRRR